jgi:hypothetical protein
MLLWWKPESLTGLNDNDPIAAWTDSSGNSNHGTASGSARPTFKGGAANGWPVARFDGVDDYMSFTSPLTNIQSAWFVGFYFTTAVDAQLLFGHATLFDWHGGHSSTTDQDHVINSSISSALVRGGLAWQDGILQSSPTYIIKPTVTSIMGFQTTGNVSASNVCNDRNGVFTNLRIAEVLLYSNTPDPAVLNTYFKAKYNI